MQDTSHLVALYESLERERARLNAATTLLEAEFRSHNIMQKKKEIEEEYKFLGMTPTEELTQISDEDLLRELGE